MQIKDLIEVVGDSKEDSRKYMTRMIELEKELKTTKQNTQFEVRKAMQNSNEYLVLNNQKLNIERENDHL